MTDQKELYVLMSKIRELGARVYVRHDKAAAEDGRDGVVMAVRILGMPGCGPFLMGPVAAAEAMRQAVAESAPAVTPLPVKRAGAQRLLDSVWTTEFIDHQDGTVTVLSYDRDNPLGYEKEKELPLVVLAESEGRIVHGLRVYGVDAYRAGYLSGVARDEDSAFFSVLNPKHVFSYGEVHYASAGPEVEFEPVPAEDPAPGFAP